MLIIENLKINKNIRESMEPRESNLENPWNLKGKRERVPGGTSDEQVGNKDMNNQQPLSLF